VKFIRFVVEYAANSCSYGLIDFLAKNITFAIEKIFVAVCSEKQTISGAM
jgi:hypothetical protein